jgi:hypothetical protein
MKTPPNSNKQVLRLSSFLLTFASLSASLLSLAAQGPVTYAIKNYTINNGVAVSSSASYKLSAAVGDTVLAVPMSGGSYVIKPGLIAQVDRPIAALSTNTLNFGNQAVNVASNPITLTLSNYGAAPLNVASATPTGDFTVIASNCGNIASNGFCTLDVTFKPTATGVRSGTLSFVANSAISAIALTGTGLINTQTITFGTAPSIAVGGSGSLTATASSGLAVTLASNTSTCNVSGNAVTGVSAGTCTITATQAGNINYSSATNSISFNIVAATQGGNNSGDVPLPDWAMLLMASGLFATMWRRYKR